MSSKQPLLPGPPPVLPPKSTLTTRPLKRQTIVILALIYFWFVLTCSSTWDWLNRSNSAFQHSASHESCPQVEPLFPNKTDTELQDMLEYLKTENFRAESIAHLSGAVQVPSESFDDLGEIGQDKRWDIFYEFASYLRSTFPLIHQTLELEMVNTHGLLYTWAGEDASLQPTLLMAHQDVVPVPKETVPAWTWPPFSGHYDGKFIWGRGSSDCKNTLIAIMESTELLLAAGFSPKRTVLFSFGFDEEASGIQGAQSLSTYLIDKYGKDSLAVIVDEGSSVGSAWGSIFATPGTAEKGYVDVRVIVRMPGGHSSIPPSHTGIGVISQLITLIEDDPYKPYLDDKNPYLGLMQCGASYGPEFPNRLKKMLPKASDSFSTAKKKRDQLAKEASKESPYVKYLMTTSIAVDVIQGGVKVNALPERTEAIVNHRINVGETSAAVKHKLTTLAKIVAGKYNLTVNAFEDADETPMSITLKARSTELPTSPVTPSSIDHLSAYSILSGTTRALYGKEVYMAPGIMTGNTDTRYYWDLSRNIFRYVAGWDPEAEGFGKIHTVDEKVSVKAHIRNVQWYTLFLRNMDEAALP